MRSCPQGISGYDEPMQIAPEKVVSVHYTLTNDAGKVLDSSAGKDPLAYLHGAGNIIPGLERFLEGKESGEKGKISVEPSEGYGEHNPGLVTDVPKSNFNQTDVKPGMQFRAEIQGQPMLFTITEVGEENVKVDGNHPLAGETLHFDVEVVDVREATREELDHGHVHGPGGHHH